MENAFVNPLVLELMGSAAAIVLMVGVAAALGFRFSAKLDAEDVARLAEDEGARVADFIIAANRQSALARLTDGRLMVVRIMGLDASARFVTSAAARVRVRSGRLDVAFADIGYPPLHMRLKDQPAWLAELASGGN